MTAKHEPTDETRQTVKDLACFGVPQDMIATYVEMDPKTLRLHYRRELDVGNIEATAMVAQTLFNMATVGRVPSAAIFWMKARAGWSEKQRVELTTPDSDAKTIDGDTSPADAAKIYAQEILGQ